MNIYQYDNEKYNVNFDLKLVSFHDFIESLKESKKYYHDYCKLENINIKDFDNEYIDTISRLESDLQKYSILIPYDNNVEKYVIVNDTIENMYNCIIKIYTNMPNGSIEYISNKNIIQKSYNINYLTREKLSFLIKIYASFQNLNYYKENKKLLQKINICSSIIELIEQNDKININKLNNYLDSLSYETIYERKLNKILNNLPNICLSNISSKKILNCCNDNYLNLIELDNNEEFINVN